MKITAVRGWNPLSDVRTFRVTADLDSDLARALASEHRCNNPYCAISQALAAGSAALAAEFLASAAEFWVLEALRWAHRFNATSRRAEETLAEEWRQWLLWWDEAKLAGRLWSCPACRAWNLDSHSCGSCLVARPHTAAVAAPRNPEDER